MGADLKRAPLDENFDHRRLLVAPLDHIESSSRLSASDIKRSQALI